MPTASPCPELDALHRLALNQSEPDEALQLQKHLVHCVPCAQMVRSLKDAGQALAETPSGRPATSTVTRERTGAAVPETAQALPAGNPALEREATVPLGVATRDYEFLGGAETMSELGRL